MISSSKYCLHIYWVRDWMCACMWLTCMMACCMMPLALPCMCLAALVFHGPVVCSATVKMGQSSSGPESQEPPKVSTLPLPIPNNDLIVKHTAIRTFSHNNHERYSPRCGLSRLTLTATTNSLYIYSTCMMLHKVYLLKIWIRNGTFLKRHVFF